MQQQWHKMIFHSDLSVFLPERCWVTQQGNKMMFQSDLSVCLSVSQRGAKKPTRDLICSAWACIHYGKMMFLSELSVGLFVSQKDAEMCNNNGIKCEICLFVCLSVCLPERRSDTQQQWGNIIIIKPRRRQWKPPRRKWNLLLALAWTRSQG